MGAGPRQQLVAEWTESIRKSGVKRIKARALLKAFGAERRGPVVVERIQKWCAAQQPRIYADGLPFLRTLDDQVELACKPITQIGWLVEEERALYERFEVEIMPRLGRLRLVEGNHRPVGTRERLDFLCEESDGTRVVVELKRDEGEGRGVQQVVGYIRALRADPRHQRANIRGILVTGRADLNTRKVLEELEPDYHIDWWIYGLDKSGRIKLAPVEVTPARARQPR